MYKSQAFDGTIFYSQSQASKNKFHKKLIYAIILIKVIVLSIDVKTVLRFYKHNT